MHYLNDYLTIGSPESEECQHNMAVMSECCRRLGVPLKLEKMEGPTTCLEFLGLTLDTCQMEARLSEAKVEALMSELDRWQARRRCRKRELLSLIGQLAHACKIIRVGRIFLRRLISLATRAKRLYHWLHMSQDARLDIAWWIVFLPAWNRKAMMNRAQLNSLPTIIIASDASGSWGCGAFWDNAWFQLPWTEEWTPWSIAAKELIPIVLACAI